MSLRAEIAEYPQVFDIDELRCVVFHARLPPLQSPSTSAKVEMLTVEQHGVTRFTLVTRGDDAAVARTVFLQQSVHRLSQTNGISSGRKTAAS